MAIQVRRGVFDKFDPTKLLPGEWAVVFSGDPNVKDGRAVYVCFAAGVVKHMATYEDMVENIANVSQDLIDEFVNQFTEAVNEATERANNAAETCKSGETERIANEEQRVENETTRATNESTRVSNELQRIANENQRASAEQARSTAESSRSSAETARATAESERAAAEQSRSDAEATRAENETARTSAEGTRSQNEAARIAAEEARASAEDDRAAAESARASAESARVTAEAGRVAEFAQMQQRADGWLIHHCALGEYDANGKPTVESPDPGTLYCVPTGDVDDPWEEWRYDEAEGGFERVGTAQINMEGIDTATIDSIFEGNAETGTEVMQTTGLSYFTAKMKEWASGVFAAISHKHSASDVTSGTLGVARGGTGSGTHAANSVLVGNGTTALKHISSTTGALFSAGAGAEPKFGTLPVAQGGTGAATAEAARENLGIDLATMDGKLCAVYMEGD